MPGEEAWVDIDRFDHCSVSGRIGHGAECIDSLSPGNPRYAIHRQHGGVASVEFVKNVLILSRPNEADETSALFDQIRFVYTQ